MRVKLFELTGTRTDGPKSLN